MSFDPEKAIAKALGIDRALAQAAVYKRKMDRAKTEEEFKRLALARNKALKEAERLEKLAELREQKQVAERQREKAKERLDIAKGKYKVKRDKGGRKLEIKGKVEKARKAFKGLREFLGVKEERAPRRKTTKQRTTKQRATKKKEIRYTC